MGILGQGVMGRVARGVPECFVTGRVVRKVEAKEKEVKKEDGVVGTTAASVAPAAPMAPIANAPAPAPAASTSSNAA